MLGYALVGYRGEHYSDGTEKLNTKRIAQAMARLEVALGYKPLTLDEPQGCVHDGSLSGGTHSRADVFDLTYDNWADKAREGAKLGIIVFVRDYDWDGRGSPAHCHCLLRGSAHFSTEAAAQVVAYDAGKDGLADGAPYQHQHYHVPDFVYQVKPKQPPPGPHYPDMAAEQFRLAAEHARMWTERTTLAALVAKHPKIPALPKALASLDLALPLVKSARMDVTHWLNAQEA